MGEKRIVFVGTFASSSATKELSIFTGFLCVEYGKITRIGTLQEFEYLDHCGELTCFKLVRLKRNQFIIPGFVDCHTHAPQFPNIGLGLDRPLLEWLDKYTFPLEKKYEDTQFAAQIYEQVVTRLLKNGTTTACYYGSLHIEGTLELVKSAIKYKQRALVGKVSMNIKNDAGYYNDTEQELMAVEIFIMNVFDFKNDLVQPVVTPRFALSCDTELMTGLAKLADKYGCRIQSHISENRKEIEHVLETYPNCKSYGDVYDKSKLFNDQCIMAHAVHITDEEIELMQIKGVSVAHCPASNTRLKSGLCHVRKLLDNNIAVGLGTDVSGGDNASILDAIRRTMDVSSALEFQGQENVAIDWKEAFYLATLGGAKALKLDHKIGNFEVGKEFDALIVDVYSPGSQIENYEFHDTDENYELYLLQRFIYLGDDRNIIQVYVKGEKVRDAL